MTTIVNTPTAQNDPSAVLGLVLGFIGVILLGYLFFVFGLPALQNMKLGTPQISIPTQVVIPDNVNVNVNK